MLDVASAVGARRSVVCVAGGRCGRSLPLHVAQNEACTRKHAPRRQRGKGGCKGGCGTLNSWRKRVPAVVDGRGSGKVSVDWAGAVGRGRTCFAP